MTGRQRAEAEQLIRTLETERESLDDLSDAQDFLARASFDALEGMILRGETAADVMTNLANAIGQAVLQSALLGEGPLAGVFGTEGSGGLLGMAIGAILPGKAEGGMIYGAGGPTDDDVLMWGSPGEFVVNAAATRRNRALLEAINAGTPAFAQGGGVGVGSGGTGRADPLRVAVDVAVDVQPSGEFDTRVQATARDVSVQVVDEYDRTVAPRTFERIQNDPRRRG